MGDVLTMIEKAEQAMTADQAAKLEQKLRNQEFDLQDFLDQLEQVQRMGPLKDLLGMIPGVSQIPGIKDMQVDEKQFRRIAAIIKSMTPAEREDPDILNASRRRRIAAGAGQEVADVNRLLKQYEMTKKMMKTLTGFAGLGPGGSKKRGKRRGLRLPFGF